MIMREKDIGRWKAVRGKGGRERERKREKGRGNEGEERGLGIESR